MNVTDYTLEDICAMAIARGSSYGVVHSALENGWQLPPLRRSTEWPSGSDHAGEDQLDASGHRIPNRPKAPNKSTMTKCHAAQVLQGTCTRCGNNASLMQIYLHKPGDLQHKGRMFAALCDSCAEEMIPPEKSRITERLQVYDSGGRCLMAGRVARCCQCGNCYDKALGLIVFTGVSSNDARVHCYICPDCTPGWIAQTKTPQHR